MAFKDRDTSKPRTGNVETTVEEIIFRRDRNAGITEGVDGEPDIDDGGPPLVVIVTKLEDGHRRSYRVPRAKVIGGWPGNAKTLKSTLLAVIDNAE